jgi:RNA polymerase sigma-70 factor (ECF subfamily)
MEATIHPSWTTPSWAERCAIELLTARSAEGDGSGGSGVRRRAVDATATSSLADERHAATSIDGMPSRVLVEKIRSGDVTAFTVVYRALRERLWRFAVTLVTDHELAHEVVQSVFVSIWTRRETLAVHDDITVYMFGAVRHHIGKHRRHENVVRRAYATFARDDAGHETVAATTMAAPMDAPDHAAERNDVRRAVAAALETLAPRERAAVLLRWGEGRTYDEIGHILGMTSMGAHKMITRALGRIRPLLDRFNDTRNR